MNRRTEIDVEDFNRRRSVAALLRGSGSGTEDVPRRPNAGLVLGVVGVLLFSAASAGGAYVSHRAPSGWTADRTLVLDRSTGARYVALDGVLHPAPTVTSALLSGATGAPVLVPHEEVEGVTAAEPLPSDGLPERPPSLPAGGRGLTACTAGAGAVDVYAAAPATRPAPEQGLLVRAPGAAEVFLVEGRRRWALGADALPALGYRAEQVRDVPAAWLDLVPRGPDLTVTPAAAPDPAAGVPGVGAAGDVVEAATSGQRYLVEAGAVRPFVNRTSELLQLSRPRVLDDAVLLAAPQGEAVGTEDAPSTPPEVAAPEDDVVACVRSSDAAVQVHTSVTDAATRLGAAHRLDTGAGTVVTTWHVRPGEGALLGPTTLDDPLPAGAPTPGTTGIVVVADGVAYPVADLPALAHLGYRRDQTVKLGTGWLALAAPGAVLRSS